MRHDKDIRIEQVNFSLEDASFRTPIKFGGHVVTTMTLLHVAIEAADRKGRKTTGRGSMPLGNVWSFPSKILTFSATMEVMKGLAKRLASITAGCLEFGHPLEINHWLEPEYLRAAVDLEKDRGLPETIPKLCT